MMGKIKDNLYFPIASYFAFFAKIRLLRWNPKIIVITGSSGKTTSLHLLESQIGDSAKYSHHANSSFGIPFNILGLHRESLLPSEWIGLFLKTPFEAFKSTPKEKIYIVEADVDRPEEGKFLASLLKPDTVLWLNVSRTHSMNFDKLVSQKIFVNVDEAIAFEYGYFLEYCKEAAVINGDSDLIIKQLSRTKAKVEEIKKQNTLEKYTVSTNGTEFKINKNIYKFTFLLPENVFYSLAACKFVMDNLNKSINYSFPNFVLPPGRSSLFRGIKKTTIVDSSYNANLTSMTVILDMFEKIAAKKKWIILGDMLEQGKEEQEEHEKLADLIVKMKVERILFMGPRVSKYTYPLVKKEVGDRLPIKKFITPKELLDYLLQHLEGEETLLFKGARFMEGVIEHLLADKNNVKKLARREKIWQIRREKWGL
jgi:UDP-N-acetylmuramoyl-tripeptide--D-alanyl-D-alanine ligase